MDNQKELCEVKHKAVDEKFKRHEKWLEEHETKLDGLEKSDARNTNQIETLTKSLSGLTKALWGLAGSIVLMLIGAIIDKF